MKGQLVLESFADVRPLTDRYRGTWAGGDDACPWPGLSMLGTASWDEAAELRVW